MPVEVQADTVAPGEATRATVAAERKRAQAKLAARVQANIDRMEAARAEIAAEQQ